MEPNNIIKQYIDNQQVEFQKHLDELYHIIKKSAPESEEVISYGMPAFKQNGILVYFAAHKNHLGFYPTSSGIENFREELTGYTFSKGAIQFPYDKPLPKKLIEKIVVFRIVENLQKAEMRKKSKK
ncbi:MAG: hypothetical protein A2W91_11010 [Bacteroidetes bacterium GWF2_38_335]|nr:MAG: hypothetical protein A2W91_11010 [Bacteroidetes bacterium GWF2_38_335]OFY81769.1 MAG: hypothetical protein A2281_06030 [Bacteroidetes bacterium RIFOXYA12_FULL_38_20]HBS87839.1 hypothetical protein [Bacteroidales bacterium]